MCVSSEVLLQDLCYLSPFTTCVPQMMPTPFTTCVQFAMLTLITTDYNCLQLITTDYNPPAYPASLLGCCWVAGGR